MSHPLTIIIIAIVLMAILALFSFLIGRLLKFTLNRFSNSIIKYDQQAEKQRGDTGIIVPGNEDRYAVLETDEFKIYD